MKKTLFLVLLLNLPLIASATNVVGREGIGSCPEGCGDTLRAKVIDSTEDTTLSIKDAVLV